MKKDIHPKYEATTITCACGNVIETRSTKTAMRIEICSNCHPIFTGKQKLVDTEGRVDRFKTLLETTKNKSAEKKTKKTRVRKQKVKYDIKNIIEEQEAQTKLRKIKKEKEEAKKRAEEMKSVKVTKKTKKPTKKDK